MSQILMTNVYGTEASINLVGFFLSIGLALVLGGVLGNLYYATSKFTTKGFVLTVALIPAITCLVVLLISGNFGAGLAVGGAFAFIRFKSIAGSAKEIIILFLSVGLGIACGSGYLFITLIFAIIIFTVFFCLCRFNIWPTKKEHEYSKILVIEQPDKENAREMLETFLNAYACKTELVECKKIYDKNREKKITSYTYELTFRDESSADALLKEIVLGKYCFNIQKSDETKKRKL